MRHTMMAALAGVAALAAPLSAQAQYNARVAAAMNSMGKYQPPLCPLKGGDMHTSSASVYLKTASEGFKDQSIGTSSVNSATYNEGLKKALGAGRDAVKANPNSAAGWYYVGRASIQMGDLATADSAFTKLEQLSPECAVEIKQFRQKAWIPLVTPSVDFLSKKMYDSVIAVTRAANIIARYYPQGYYNLAAAFASMTPSQPDSAIFYFKIAEEKAGSDPSTAETLKSTIFNLGYLYSQTGDNADAIVEYRKYLVIDPTNESIKRSLAASLRATNNNAEAIQIENELMAAGKLSSGELSGVGVRAFNSKDYAGAAEAFKKVLAVDPYNHDALFNLANAYYALEDGKNLVAASQKLLETDPLNSMNVKLLANGWRLDKNQDKQIEVVTQLQAMTTSVSVEHFTPRKDGAKLTGTATGVEGRNAADKVIPPTAITLVFEFTDASGAVVGTQEAAIGALAPNAKQEFSVDVTGAGITGWKYHKK